MVASSRVYLAVDLGASSGRLLAGLFDGEILHLEEVHRFANGPVNIGARMHWDVLGLWREILDGLKKASLQYGDRIATVGVDTWGVDFALLGRDDELLGNPYHYRDRRTQGILPEAFRVANRETIFAETGLQFMEFNTLYQLWAMHRENSSLLEASHCFLMIPDLFHWMLTGNKANEQTNATTTQLYNPISETWSARLLMQFGLRPDIMQSLVPPGTRLGPLRKEVAEQTGLHGVEVVLPGTHDTASAVMSVPALSSTSSSPDWCYISSGTWSLMGVEVARPVITDACRRLNFTNEGGVGGTTRLLKNIAGLWLIQECRRCWQEEGQDHDWTELIALAEEAAPLVSLIDPDHPDFVAPHNMPAAIRHYCQQSGQKIPESPGAMIRCCLESLALRYRMVMGWLEELIDGQIETIHVVGGGSQNGLLCQMTADACHCRVVAGPVEATAVGNVMMQIVAAGDLDSIAQGREVIARSFPVQPYSPGDPEPWDEAFARFRSLIEG